MRHLIIYGSWRRWTVRAAGGPAIRHGAAGAPAGIARLEDQCVRCKAEMIHSPVCRMSIILDPEGDAILVHELEQR